MRCKGDFEGRGAGTWHLGSPVPSRPCHHGGEGTKKAKCDGPGARGALGRVAVARAETNQICWAAPSNRSIPPIGRSDARDICAEFEISLHRGHPVTAVFLNPGETYVPLREAGPR